MDELGAITRVPVSSSKKEGHFLVNGTVRRLINSVHMHPAVGLRNKEGTNK